MPTHMSILTKITGLYESFRRRRCTANWASDVKIFLKDHEDPYNLAGLELVLLHLSKARVQELSVQQRKHLSIYTFAPNVETVLDQLVYARLHVTSREGIVPGFFDRSEPEQRLRRFDDFFTTTQGHVVEIIPLVESLTGLTQQLIDRLQELEANDTIHHAYYLRKLRRLTSDLFHTLQAMLETSFQPSVRPPSDPN